MELRAQVANSVADFVTLDSKQQALEGVLSKAVTVCQSLVCHAAHIA